MEERQLVLPGSGTSFDGLDEVADFYGKWNRGAPKNRGVGITRGNLSDKHANKKKHKKLLHKQKMEAMRQKELR
jgi:hypothetical protein